MFSSETNFVIITCSSFWSVGASSVVPPVVDSIKNIAKVKLEKKIQRHLDMGIVSA